MGSFKIGHFVAPEDMVREVNCYDWYEKMRHQSPVRYDKKRRCWDVFRYKDVKDILVNYSVFSSVRSKDKVDNLLSMDPPEHKRFRTLASKDLGHRYVKRMETLLQDVTDQTLQNISAKDQIDFIQEVAFPIPITMMMRLLGIPEQHYEKVIDMGVGTLSRSYSTGKPLKIALKNVKNAIQGGNVFFEQIMREKRLSPEDDMISDMLQRHGDKVETSLLRDFLRTVLSAGSETSVNMIGNAMYLFLTQSNVIRDLQAEPALIPNAIEEVLRYYPSIHCLNRIATQDINIGGCQIQKGDEVVVWLASANRDEEVFPQASQFQIDRSPNPHVSFGYGIHVCLGSSLARLEAKIIFTQLLQRNLKMKISEEPVRNANFVFQGFEHMNIKFF